MFKSFIFALYIQQIMVTYPNAKINLGLFVTEKRPDNYHNIETVFYPIPLCDEIECEISESNTTTITISGMNIDGDSNDNLIIKAYNQLKRQYQIPAVSIHLKKNIPFGAGLGGGSADAAFTLKLINHFFSLGLSDAQLEIEAAKIGADCPFFIKNQPVFASGIGNVFTPIDLSLKGYYILLVKPSIHVSTPNAYKSIVPCKPSFDLQQINNIPLSLWKHHIINDFEKPVFYQYPEIEQIKNSLYNIGAVYSSMSGSGSSVFGIFENKPIVTNLFQNYFVWGDFLS